MYDTAVEADQKLKGTVIFHGDDPIYVYTAQEGSPIKLQYRAYNKDLHNPKVEYVGINSGSLDMKELGNRLGYVNCLSGEGIGIVTYTRRTPVRKAHSTQGLSDSNVKCDKLHSIAKFGLSARNTAFSLLENKGMEETLRGKYPSLSQVRYKMGKNETVWEMAFDPCLAVCRDANGLWKLHYKGGEIGWTDDLFTFRVGKEFRYLDELFEVHKMRVRS